MKIERLKSIFGDCKRPNTSNCSFATSYEIIGLKEFYIYDNRLDSKQPVTIVKSPEDNFQLSIVNNNEQEICLIKTDKCLFTDEHKKCDCVLFNSNQVFFVEISEASLGSRNSKRRDAVEQLGYTIRLLKDAGVELYKYDSKAIICFKSGITKPTQASNNSNSAIFKEQYGVKLEEGNKIVFA